MTQRIPKLGGLRVHRIHLSAECELGLCLADENEQTTYFRVWAASYRLETDREIVAGNADPREHVLERLEQHADRVRACEVVDQDVVVRFESGTALRLFATHSTAALCWILNSAGVATGIGIDATVVGDVAGNAMLGEIAAELRGLT